MDNNSVRSISGSGSMNLMNKINQFNSLRAELSLRQLFLMAF